MKNGKRLRILTWHVHGTYLWYLSQTEAEFYLPVKKTGEQGYGGKTPNFPWGDNVHAVRVSEIARNAYDLILFQSRRNYLVDQFELLTPAQRQLPRIYLEHDPPREHPTDTRHVVWDPSVLVVHVSQFNNLMWDNGPAPTHVIRHGVNILPDVSYSGKLAKGIVVVNNLKTRGRRLGADIVERVRKIVPLDIVGMGSDSIGGLGEIPPPDLAGFISRYRFFFHPVRYTSLGLAVCEAMTVGLPVVGFATTELPGIIKNGVTGFTGLSEDILISRMKDLLEDISLAHRISDNARSYASKAFAMPRFRRDWNQAFDQARRLSRNLKGEENHRELREVSFNGLGNGLAAT